MPRGPYLDVAGQLSSRAGWNAGRSFAPIPSDRVFCAGWRCFRTKNRLAAPLSAEEASLHDDALAVVRALVQIW